LDGGEGLHRHVEGDDVRASVPDEPHASEDPQTATDRRGAGLVSAGDHVIGQKSTYGGTASVLLNLLPRLGITTTQVDQMRVCAWPQWLLQVRCPALGLSVSVSGEGWSLGSSTAAIRPIRPINARTTMAIP
jgi:hypothetical protein